MRRRGEAETHQKVDFEQRLLQIGVALLVDWSSTSCLRTFELFDNDLRSWWGRSKPDWNGARFDYLKGRQRKRLAELSGGTKEALLGRVRGWSGEVLLCDDQRYPSGLLELDRPPSALHVVGDVNCLDQSGLAVVGSRKISVAAAKTARTIMQPAIRSGLMVVSGGALGADAVAHRCAMDAGGVTVAVLPAGLEKLSPKSNQRLFADIAEGGGALVSEYPPHQGVRRYHFRRRNRLLAAMSRGVMVLRAAQKSGTMLTVRAARDLERPLGAIPGTPQDPLSYGCHDILRSGGRLIAEPRDLNQWWSEISGDEQSRSISRPPSSVEETMDARQLPDCPVLRRAGELLDEGGAFSSEALARKVDLSAAELQTVLLRHELSGLIERAAGGDRYRFR